MLEERQTKMPWPFWVMAVFAVLIAVYGFVFAMGGAEAFYEGRDPAVGLAVAAAAITVHAIVGGMALLTGPTQFHSGLRRRNPALHRTIGRVHVAAALGTGLSGFFVAGFAEGGLVGRIGFAVLGVLTTTYAMLGLRSALRRRFGIHRQWMVRSFAMLLAAVSLRIQIPFLFMLFDGDETMVFAVVAWTSWVPNALIAEWILRRRPAELAVELA
mgnify:CR=1 FL=1